MGCWEHFKIGSCVSFIYHHAFYLFFYFSFSLLSGSAHMMYPLVLESAIFKELWFLLLEDGTFCPLDITNLFSQRSFKLIYSKTNFIPQPCPCNTVNGVYSSLVYHSKCYTVLAVAQIKNRCFIPESWCSFRSHIEQINVLHYILLQCPLSLFLCLMTCLILIYFHLSTKLRQTQRSDDWRDPA